MLRMLVFFSCLLMMHSAVLASEWSYEAQTKLGLGGSFFESSPDPMVKEQYSILRAESDLVLWQGGNEVVIHPLVQYRPDDDTEYYGDFRQLLWRHTSENQTVTAGFQQFFWGSLESANPVNILNQVDLQTGLEKYDRLGMPALSLDHRTDAGSLSLILLTGFREREFL